MPFIEKFDSIVFAPHPDDEALGCAGMIYNDLKKGRMIKVVLLTNGDADTESWERLHDYKPSYKDMIEYGCIRQRETVSAMTVLGIKEKDIVFLGYPDNGLLDILSTNKYTKTNPFKSIYTGLTSKSYENSYHKNAPYCKASLIADLVDLLDRYQPKRVFTTHPMDRHRDHRASGEIIKDIVKQMKKPIPIYGYYISHVSKVYNLKAAHKLFYKVTRKLKEFPLNEDTSRIKERCLDMYKTQEYFIKPSRKYFIRKESYWRLM